MLLIGLYKENGLIKCIQECMHIPDQCLLNCLCIARIAMCCFWLFRTEILYVIETCEFYTSFWEPFRMNHKGNCNRNRWLWCKPFEIGQNCHGELMQDRSNDKQRRLTCLNEELTGFFLVLCWYRIHYSAFLWYAKQGNF